jgi:AbrB family looped-hinge helix DNA binding protein
MNHSTVTERGQVSVPAELRKAMRLRAGQKLAWEKVSDREMRVWIPEESPPGPLSVLGYARRMRGGPSRRTKDWMHELREGE